MSRYKYDGLSIEITRRCNRVCQHCMLGDAQPITMTTEIIDRLFQDIADCSHISFVGGECLLEMDKIEYFVDKIVESNWNVKTIQITTNGSILDKRIVDVFTKFCAAGNDRYALLRISNDEFHDKEESATAYRFYSELTSNANRLITNNSKFDCKLTQAAGKLGHLRYAGRAVGLFNNDGHNPPQSCNYIFRPTYNPNHRIRIDRLSATDAIVRCSISVLATGNICADEEVSYKTLDAASMGNILNDSLVNIIDKHNNECMVLCHEAEQITLCNLFLQQNVDKNFNLQCLIYQKIIDRLFELRQLARKKFPYVSAQDIISTLPGLPQKEDVPLLFVDFYMHSKFRNQTKYIDEIMSLVGKETILEMLKDSKKLSDQELECRLMHIAILAHVNNASERRYPYELFGSENDILSSEEFRMLAKLNSDYELGIKQASDEGTFECEANGLFLPTPREAETYKNSH